MRGGRGAGEGERIPTASGSKQDAGVRAMRRCTARLNDVQTSVRLHVLAGERDASDARAGDQGKARSCVGERGGALHAWVKLSALVGCER